jgi:hypothetical protein
MAEIKALPLDAGDDITLPLQAYTEHQQRMELASHLMGGTAAMRKAGKTYLPQEEAESDVKYLARLERTTLYNGYKRTLKKLVGEVFSMPIAESEDMEDELKDWCNNIDNAGTNINKFCMNVLEDGIHNGVTHLMVDYPPTHGAKTVAQQKALKARPYWVSVKSKSVIGWRFEMVDGAKRLAQLRIKEDVEKANGKYGVTTVERIRILEPGKFTVYEKNDAGDWEIAIDDQGRPMEGTTSLTVIPFVTLMFGDTEDDMTALPPLDDLCWLNLTHWQSSSDQRNVLHYARLVTYFGKNLDTDEDGKVVFGVNRLVHGTAPDSDLKIVEHSGHAITAGRQDLEDLKDDMAIFGMSLMIANTGTQTATEKTIDKGENDSILKGWVRLLNSGMEECIKLMGMWNGTEYKGVLTANDDFKTMLRSHEGELLLKMVQLQILPKLMVIEEFKARGTISQEVDFVELEKLLEDDRRKGDALSGLTGISQSIGQV